MRRIGVRRRERGSEEGGEMEEGGVKSKGREDRGVRSEEERVFNKDCVVGAS